VGQASWPVQAGFAGGGFRAYPVSALTRRINGPAVRTAILTLWVLLIVLVVIGSLLPATSPVIQHLDRLDISDKVMHFSAYLMLALLPVIGFRDRRRGIAAGLSMFLLGVLLEALQHSAPGRTVELGDLIANGAGVACGILVALPLRKSW
jgi:VanZ family protein